MLTVDDVRRTSEASILVSDRDILVMEASDLPATATPNPASSICSDMARLLMLSTCCFWVVRTVLHTTD
jgi:hypothetical protein